MYSIFINLNIIDFSFVSSLGLSLGNIITKFDPKIYSLINKTIIEKRLFNTKLTLLSLIIIFSIQTLLIDLNYLFNLNSWDQLLYFWLSIFLLLFFITAYNYYKALYKLLKFFNFSSFKYLPTLNIYKILPPEYFISVSFLYSMLCNFISVNDIIFFYLLFEITNIIIYTIIGITQNSSKASEASVKYYFISFLSSLFCLWGTSYIYGFSGISKYSILIALLYNLEFSHYNISFGVLVGFIYILLSFFIKLGAFPCHLWVTNVYEKTSNFNFLFLITIVKTGFYFSMLQYIINLIIKPLFNFYIFLDIFSLISIGSVITGSFLLITRGTVKGFLAANSIIS